MSFLKRLIGAEPDPRQAMQPLWHRVVAIAREEHWFAERGVADTVEGRFDMICSVMCMVLLRMEREPSLIPPSVYLTEIFVDQMDGDLRQAGVGDLMVGKHIGKLMSVLGGRLGAYREALKPDADAHQFESACERNLTLVEGSSSAAAAQGLRDLIARLERTSNEQILAGDIAE